MAISMSSSLFTHLQVLFVAVLAVVQIFLPFADAPRNKYVCLLHVLLELGVVFVLFFKQGHSTHKSNQQSDEKWRVKCHIADIHRDCEQVDAPPQQCLAKVVWMSRVAPEPCLDELGLAW